MSINIPRHQSPYAGNNYALTTNTGNIGNIGSNHVSNLQLSPLLSLQRNIATCFEEVHNTYYNHPVLSTQVSACDGHTEVLVPPSSLFRCLQYWDAFLS